MITFQSIGVSLLFVMGLCPSIWTTRWLILPIFIVRTMANNCCYAIIRSLLMDYVPKVRPMHPCTSVPAASIACSSRVLSSKQLSINLQGLPSLNCS